MPNNDENLDELIKLLLININNVEIDSSIPRQEKAYSIAKLATVIVDAEELIRQYKN